MPDLLVAGSLATGDYIPGVIDIDLVAVVDGPLDATRQAYLIGMHEDLDRGAAAGDDGRPGPQRRQYWTWAARRPRMWLNPVIADLGLTSMARGRHTIRTGTLLTKTAAIDLAAAPPWLIDDLHARRRGERVTSPRFRTGWIAWKDALRTTTAARSVPKYE